MALVASAALTPAGTTTFALYAAVRMPPSTAVPSTAPSSYAVSEIADAAPALSAGTLEMITSLEIVSAAPMPSDSSTNASAMARRRGLVGAQQHGAVAGRADQQTTGDDDARGDPAHQRHHREPGHDGDDQARQQDQAGLHRALAEHQLQVLGDEEQEADQREHAEQVGQHRAAERTAGRTAGRRASAAAGSAGDGRTPCRRSSPTSEQQSATAR